MLVYAFIYALYALVRGGLCLCMLWSMPSMPKFGAVYAIVCSDLCPLCPSAVWSMPLYVLVYALYASGL